MRNLPQSIITSNSSGYINSGGPDYAQQKGSLLTHQLGTVEDYVGAAGKI